MTVFANGLEISAKAQSCKLIAAMPDVCMTPPQTPATPPGVPIPYPNFGFDSDLTSGSTKVLIGGKMISMENKSKYSKVSGDEAGCAPKKGIITSNNTGPMYAQAWSMNVKVQNKGVVRFGDIATSNHGCNPGQPAPMPVVGKPGAGAGSTAPCDKVLAEFNIHRHGDTKHSCPEGHESEHFVQNEYLQYERGVETAPQFQNYTTNGAPCICMESYTKKNGKYTGKKTGSPHNLKTRACNAAIRGRTKTPTLGEVTKDCCRAVVENDPRCKGDPKKQKVVAACLEMAFMEYLDKAVKEKNPKNSAAKASKEPIAFEVNSDPTKMWVRV